MKRVFAYIIGAFICLAAQAQTASEIAHYVEQRSALCQTQPDSLFPTIRQLERMRAEATDSVAWAFLSELLYRTYNNFMPNTQHDAEGDKLEEWGREQWRAAADACLRDALTPIRALHGAKASAWLPLIQRMEVVKRPDVRTAQWFGDDVLHVFHLAHPTRAVADFYAETLGGNAAIYAAWRAHGDVDSLLRVADADARVTDDLKIHLYYDKITRSRLATAPYMIDPTWDVVESAEDVVEPAEQNVSPSVRDSLAIVEQVRLCNECLSRFGSNAANRMITNFLNSLRQPDLQVEWPQLVYPDADYTVPVRYRNIQGIEVSIGRAKYMLPTNGNSPYHYVVDTLRFRAPQRGAYKVVVRPRTTEKSAGGAARPKETQMAVSALRLLRLDQPDGEALYKVVDAMSGEEVRGHKVVTMVDSSGWRPVKKVSIEGEPQAPVQVGDWARFDGRQERRVCTRIYTDRAVYRPADKVYVTVCRYEQYHWDAKVMAGDTLKIDLYDRHNKLLSSERLVTAANGCCGTSFTLPKDGALGMYYVRVGNEMKSIRVEEYKRPTFEVSLPDSLQPALILTARNYNGTPLRGARVTGTVRRIGGWWRAANDSTTPIDTLTTDADGQAVIPVDTLNSSTWNYVIVAAKVTAASGETHDVSRTYWLHHDPAPANPTAPHIRPMGEFRCVRDVINTDSAAVIEVESCYDDVHLFVTVFRHGKIIDDRQVTFSNDVVRLEFADSLLYGCKDADGLGVSLAFMKDNRMYAQSFQLRRAQPDTKLRWVWDTFRDRVRPGDTEVWTGRLLTPEGKPADASAIFCLYDASLDMFGRNDWAMNVYRGYRIFSNNYANLHSAMGRWLSFGFGVKYLKTMSYYDMEFKSRVMDALAVWRQAKLYKTPMLAAGMPVRGEYVDRVVYDCAASMNTCEEAAVVESETDDGEEQGGDEIATSVRENFQETAFYTHSLSTDADGRITMSFTLPDAVTTWRLMGVAHTSDMMTAEIEAEAIAQKNLMAMVSVPRFYRRGDEAWAAVTVQNLSQEKRKVRLTVDVLDAATETKIKKRGSTYKFTLERDTTITLRIDATDDVIVRAKVTDGEYSDGEQRLVPMLEDDSCITRSTDITCSGIGEHTFGVDSLFAAGDLERRVTVTYTESPIWTAVDVMRNLQKPEYCDLVSLHTSIYANVLLKYLAEKYESVARYLEYDRNKQEERIADLRSWLSGLEATDGGYSWMPGFLGCEWQTREVATTFARLKMMTGTDMPELERAIQYLSRKEKERVEEMKRDTTMQIGFSDIHYLYIRAISGRDTLARHDRYLMKCLRKMLAQKNVVLTREQMAVVTLVLEHLGDKREAQRVRTRMREFLVADGRNGASFSYLRGSFTSIDRKLLNHVFAMEALEAGDTLLPAMRRYLLRQKRVQAWENPLVNASAVYALLLQQPVEQAAHDRIVIDGKRTLEITDGYAKTTFTVQQRMKTLTVEKQGAQESWGTVYVESRQKLENIKPQSYGLGVKLYVDGDTCRVGDKIQMRIVLHADMDYECVHLSVGRAAATEPVAANSGYCYQGGLGYYREVRDTSDELFIGHLPKGDYVLLLPAYAASEGRYSVGIARAECMYAPEFCGNSVGHKLVVGK